MLRYDYSIDEISELFSSPLTRLISLSLQEHQQYHRDDEVQLCSLLSIKTGGCKEDCHYCPQSAHHQSNLEANALLANDKIIERAKIAKEQGATRFCMGGAWRSPPKQEKVFTRLLKAASSVNELGLQVCMTLGLLDEQQAVRLKEAGVYAYNHNLDTSPEYYPKIITTRTYDDRLKTLRNVRKAGMTVCCGGIVGMGEQRADRLGLLQQLSSLNPHPESVPINLLVRVEGTPLADSPSLDIFELIRTIATARIIMPTSKVRLSAGRTEMNDEAQALCFLAGANSIFMGDKLLTTKNPEVDDDFKLLNRLGLKAMS